jgi:hypothetical protein
MRLGRSNVLVTRESPNAFRASGQQQKSVKSDVGEGEILAQSRTTVDNGCERGDIPIKNVADDLDCGAQT